MIGDVVQQGVMPGRKVRKPSLRVARDPDTDAQQRLPLDQRAEIDEASSAGSDAATEAGSAMLPDAGSSCRPETDTDLVVPSALPATLREALAALATNPSISQKHLRSYGQSVGWFERRLPHRPGGEPAEPLPCNPAVLRPILNGISPGRHRISPKRWSNLRSDIVNIQRATGWLPPLSAKPLATSMEWQLIVSLVVHAPVRDMFRAFAVFCDQRSLQPAKVTEQHFADYQVHLERTGTRLHPENTIKAMRFGWNRLIRDFPDCGILPMARKPMPNTLWTAAKDIPASFYADLDKYLEKLRNPGLFAPGFRHNVAEMSIHNMFELLRLSASILVKRGWPAANFTCVAAILTPAAVEAILTDYHARNCAGGAWTTGARSTAARLTTAARQWGQLSEPEFAEVKRLCHSVKPPRNNFPKKTRERLAQFDHKSTERRFLELADNLWKKAQEHLKQGRPKRAAQTAKYALALAILLDKPLRVKNLARLDLELDFARNAKGKITGIRIQGERTTKGAPIIEGALSRRTLHMLEIYLQHYRPEMLTDHSCALFPGGVDGHADKNGFGTRLSKIVKTEIGIDFNPHLIRSLVGTIILDENPRAPVLAQRMLDHKNPATTAGFYAMQRGRAVAVEYAELMHRRMRRLKA